MAEYNRFEDASEVFPEFGDAAPYASTPATNALSFLMSGGHATAGRYNPGLTTPGVQTEDDAFRENYARDREVLDAINMGWFVPRGGALAAKTAVDYLPSRMSGSAATRGNKRGSERNTIFENATGIFPDYDAAAPRSGFQSMLESIVGRNKFAERRARSPQQLFTDPKTGERYQTWPEALLRSASTLAGDVYRGEVAGGPSTLGMRAEDYTDIPAGGDEREGGIPGLRSLFNPLQEPQRDNPAALLMERAQDLAGVLGGGPLTERPSAATLASGAKRPTIISKIEMTRRGIFDAFRSQPEVAEPRAPLDVGQNAPLANLPAVQDPLARLIGGEAPKSRLLEELTTPPEAKVPQMPHAELTDRLAKLANPNMNRRAVLRGMASAAANASRIGKVGELLAKPIEASAVPKEVLKFEEIWKTATNQDWDAITPQVRKTVEDDFLENTGMTKKQAIKEHGNKEEYNNALMDHFYEEAGEEGWSGAEGITRYGDYQLPGGENYRELLIKHPDQLAEYKLRSGPQGTWGVERPDGTLVGSYKSKAEAEKLHQAYIGQNAPLAEGRNFYSSTWDEPNVLGHLRMHDRDIPGVGRSTHLEELNSEWHQEGQKKGYGKSNTEGWTATRGPDYHDGRWSWKVKNAAGEVVDEVYSLPKAASADVVKRSAETKFKGVPDAPLKKEWPDYLLRRAIKEAVDNNHDAVSWTPGEQQANRYGIQAHVVQGHPIGEFYDKHLVERANEIGKQYGTKVEKHKLGGKEPTAEELADPGLPAAATVAKRVKTDIPVLRITPQLRKAVKDGTFSLLSDSGKPGAPLAALEKAVGSVAQLRRGLGVDAGTPSGRATDAALKAIDEALRAGTSGVPRVSLPGVKRQVTTEEALKAIDEALKLGKDLYSDSGKPGAVLAALEHAQPFYSAAERALSSAKFDKGSPEQWLGYLRNQPGVRKEELEHLGLGDKAPEAWVGKKSLTKDEVLAHVKDKAPQIKEVWKSSERPNDEQISDMAWERAHEQWQNENLRERSESEANYDRRWQEHVNDGRADDAVEAAYYRLWEEGVGRKPVVGTKYHEYQLPGGENYREMLMTIPSKPGPDLVRWNELVQKVKKSYGSVQEYIKNLEPTQRQGVEQLRQAAVREEQTPLSDYRSSHWDEPNVLAHARMNDRQIPGTGRSLHLEELQSDWHQAGRKQGYKEQKTGNWKIVKNNDGYQIESEGTPIWVGQSREVAEQRLADFRNRQVQLNKGVPDAPFKQTWPDLLLKRLVHEAAVKGYDSISWTPGEAQAARYDLSRHFTELNVRRRGDGQYQIQGKGHGREPGFGHSLVDGAPPEKLADYVGKDLAERIIGDKIGVGDAKAYFGVDLKVGGEGMRAFYDKMLVDKANALGKKHGAKVEQKEIPSGKQGSRYHLQNVGGVETLISESGARDVTDPATVAAWKKAVKPKAQPVHVMKITPQLRAAVLKDGFPLFAAGLPFGALDDKGR